MLSIMQNALSSRLRSKNVKIKIYVTIILLTLYGCETWISHIEIKTHIEGV
jgi:hypothetical protein